jgi:hypothetical protein
LKWIDVKHWHGWDEKAVWELKGIVIHDRKFSKRDRDGVGDCEAGQIRLLRAIHLRAVGLVSRDPWYDTETGLAALNLTQGNNGEKVA